MFWFHAKRPAPKTPVGEVFITFRWQFQFFFCIHNIKANTARMYIMKGRTRKQLIKFVLFQLTIWNKIRLILKNYLFSDNCWKQNKNHTLLRKLLSLPSTCIYRSFLKSSSLFSWRSLLSLVIFLLLREA